MARGYYPALVLHTRSARLIMEKESHLGKRRENRRERESEGEGRDLRLLTVSTASAAFIRSGDWGIDREFERANKCCEGAVEELVRKYTELERNSDRPCWHSFANASLSASAACCSLHCEYASSFGKTEEPQGGVNFWHKRSALRHLDTSEGM